MQLNYHDNPKNEYTFNGVKLEAIDKEKDLGVINIYLLSWNDHIKKCISKSNQMIAWVTRCIISREKGLMNRIYKTIIRPHLEYASQLWSPTATHGNWGIILELEAVQRRCTRLINGIGTLPYSQRLMELNLTTLAERRLRGDLIETFRVVNGHVD